MSYDTFNNPCRFTDLDQFPYISQDQLLATNPFLYNSDFYNQLVGRQV